MSRSASSINPRLNKKLAAYAAAATTAIGAGTLSSAQPAEAVVVYTKTHIEVNTGTPIDLNDKFKYGARSCFLSGSYSTPRDVSVSRT